MKISACIITDDNERVFKAIESVQDSCFEIIVNYNGKSAEFKKRLEAIDKVKVFEYEWKDDFGHARNFVMDKCSGDWILNIDSDEILVGNIPELDKSKTHYLFRIINGERSTNRTEYWNARIVQNNKKIRYINKIHEIIPIPHDENLKVVSRDLQFVHYGIDESTPEEMKAKYERNLRILLKDKKNSLYDYHLANLYFSAGNCYKAIEHGVRAMASNKIENEFKAIMCNMVFTCYVKLGITSLKESLEYCPHQIFARMNLAHYLEQDGQEGLLIEQLTAIETIIENNLSRLPCDIQVDINLIKNKIGEIQCHNKQAI